MRANSAASSTDGALDGPLLSPKLVELPWMPPGAALAEAAVCNSGRRTSDFPPEMCMSVLCNGDLRFYRRS